MPSALQIVGLLFTASKGVFQLFRAHKAQVAAQNYLITKYSLSKPYYQIEQKGNWPIGTMQLKDDWHTLAQSLFNSLIEKQQVDNECYELCAEMAMLCGALDLNNPEYLEEPLCVKLKDLYKGETYLSLLEMGRGRGGEYAFKLIQRELAAAS